MSLHPENRNLKIIETEDGSSSLYVPSLNETYHSFHGALAESRHVFIKEGLAHWHKTYGKTFAKILELGFGTGLNTILTVEYALRHSFPIHYDTLEAYPLEAIVAEKLNYPKLLQDDDLATIFSHLHAAPWNEPVSIDTFFTLHKRNVMAEAFMAEASCYDVVFFDAFAPNKQAELWTVEILEKFYRALAPEGILVTYCAKGQFKRDLKAIGYEVETLSGPPGKKEMVRATKTRE